MKKYFFAFALALLVIGILFRNQLMVYLQGPDALIDYSSEDPFKAYRAEFGTFSNEDYEAQRANIRVVLAHRKGGPGLPDEAEIDPLDRSYRAFLKAYDLKPSGWHLETVRILWDEFADFYNHYGHVNSDLFTQGQFAG